MKITEIDRPSLRALQEKMVAALQPVAAEFGISLKLGRTVFNANSATIKIEAAVINANGMVESKDAQAYKQCAKWMDLPEDGLGKRFSWMGNVYYVRGLRPKSRKAPILVEREDGKMFKMPVEAVKAGLLSEAKK